MSLFARGLLHRLGLAEALVILEPRKWIHFRGFARLARFRRNQTGWKLLAHSATVTSGADYSCSIEDACGIENDSND